MPKTYDMTVVQDLGWIGDYSVRVIENPKTKVRYLDIREYIQPNDRSSFEGFTRKGICVRQDLYGTALRLVAEAAKSLNEEALVGMLTDLVPSFRFMDGAPEAIECGAVITPEGVATSANGFKFEYTNGGKL